MEVPVEVHMQGLEHLRIGKDELLALIRAHAEQLERVCDHIISCRVAVEVPNRHVDRGSGIRVRIEVTVPRKHDLVVRREPHEGHEHMDAAFVLRDAFDAMARQLRKLNAKQHGAVKLHQDQQVQALVERIHDDYGFLRTAADQRQIYFHRNSVLAPGFDALREGAGVAFTEEEGEEGPQASTVRPITSGAAAPPMRGGVGSHDRG